ncbi:LysE/ArgO family amino acid transporter [Pseudodesulfovibrio tunisiensis]|uniref:LysE/ArgO family amino acid transporter n=1 Tax=Pseudodesulfovibrio tunisiensis TaxID=463192 RepID=UPI001FB46056|nr:LysE/ArgO family amino acid transporter [Pseudodesulfovibrio tunisiensis]
MVSTAYVQGLAMGGGLIVAIGAQNAFVLTQGVRRNHPLAVALLCILCDAVFISLGVSGVGTAVAANPILGEIAAWGGALFLFWYGWGAMRSAIRGGRLEIGTDQGDTLRRTLAMTLAVTLLNPHFYLDTVVLMGSISGQYPAPDRYWFGSGAITASLIWFACLTLGGGLLAPLFRKAVTWRVLDSVVCLTMWYLALSLTRSALAGGLGVAG